MYFKTREENLIFMKRLWQNQPTPCPKCQDALLVPLHKKAKKDNNDWKCPACGEIYRTISMLYELPER